MSEERIPIAGPWISEREVRYAADAAANAWYSRAGEYPARFEAAMADYLGVRHAVSLPHCTSAIHLSLLALGVGPGDEVIVPDITWIATAAPVTYVGATTVFADIEPSTWCLSAESFRDCITPRTAAVIPVDLYGGVPDMDPIRQIAAESGIAVVEDAAESIGSEYRGGRAGSLGDTGVLSFHGSKTVTTGEGGMLVTDRLDLYQRVLFLRDHGRKPGDRLFLNAEVAYKYRMSALQAAVGLAQLERVEELVSRKRQIYGWYAEQLADLDVVRLNSEPEGTKNSYWMVTAVFAGRPDLEKGRLMEALDREGIDTRPFFHPLSGIPAYEGSPQSRAARERNVVSYALSPYGINLPSALNLTQDQVRRVCETLKRVVEARRK